MNIKINYITLGFGFFAMLFGAGNLLFPPLLGIHAGEYWWLSITGFIISDAILSLLMLYVFSRIGSLKDLCAPLGKKFIPIYGAFIIITVFALFLIPRTASMTYELSIQPFVGENFNSWYFYILYFVFVLAFTIKQSKVIDTLGKYLAPILAFTILTLIIAGIMEIPSTYISNTSAGSSFKEGFIGGYQTADMLGMLFQASFAVAILNTQGLKTIEQRQGILIKAGIVTVLMFIILYFGLGFVGAKIGSSVPTNISTVGVLQYIALHSLGGSGSIILGFTVFITCVTTTIGVLSFVSHYLSDHLLKNISYKKWAIFLSLVGVLIGHKGVDFIIKIAGPVLLLTYPIMIVLLFLHLFQVKNARIIKITCYTSFIFSIVDALASLKIIWATQILNIVPFGKTGFIWLLPSILAYFIALYSTKKKSSDCCA